MDRSVHPTEWKPEASTGNLSQSALALIGEVPKPATLEMFVVRQASFSGVLNHAAKHSGMEDWDIADKIHISHGYMSKFMRTVGQQWAKRLIAFMRVTNSLAPLQWMAHQMGCEVVVLNELQRERDELRARLADIDRRERFAA